MTKKKQPKKKQPKKTKKSPAQPAGHIERPWPAHGVSQTPTAAEKIAMLELELKRVYGERDEAKAANNRHVRVLRLVEYAGERDAVEEQVRGSVHGTVEVLHGRCLITAVTLHDYPEVLKIARSAPSVNVATSDAGEPIPTKRGQSRSNY